MQDLQVLITATANRAVPSTTDGPYGFTPAAARKWASLRALEIEKATEKPLPGYRPDGVCLTCQEEETTCQR